MTRRRRRPLVAGSEAGLQLFKAQVMQQEGYAVNPGEPDNVKYEVASSLGIPLQKGYNGGLNSESAGKVGGQIGGAMVREMIRMAQQKLQEQTRKS